MNGEQTMSDSLEEIRREMAAEVQRLQHNLNLLRAPIETIAFKFAIGERVYIVETLNDILHGPTVHRITARRAEESRNGVERSYKLNQVRKWFPEIAIMRTCLSRKG